MDASLKLSPFEWLAVSGHKAQFTHSAACEITGLSSDTLLNWKTRGIVASERPGSGTWKKYCGHDLIVFALARKLVQLGLGAKESAQLASQIWLALSDHLTDARRGRVGRFSDFNNTIAVVRSAGAGEAKKVRVEFGLNRLLEADIVEGDPIIVFACGRVVSKIIDKARRWPSYSVERRRKVGSVFRIHER